MERLRSDAFDAHGGASKGERLLAEPILVEALNETRDAANVFKLSSAAAAGGAASEALTVTGLLANDEILAVSQRVAGASNTAVTGFNTQIADGLTVEWTADPGAGAIVDVEFRRVTA